MNGIFGVGPLEVVVVLILVLLVFGPERLPELTRNLGSMIRRLRETYLQFVTEFRDELAPIATEIDAATRDLRQDLYAIREAADIRGLIPTITADELNPMKPLPPGTTTPPATTALPPAQPAAAFTAPALPSAKNVSVNGTSNANGVNGHANSIGGGISNGRHASTGTGRPAHTPKAGPPVSLSDDNPWASVGAVVRSDKLDDDNPWKS